MLEQYQLIGWRTCLLHVPTCICFGVAAEGSAAGALLPRSTLGRSSTCLTQPYVLSMTIRRTTPCFSG